MRYLLPLAAIILAVACKQSLSKSSGVKTETSNPQLDSVHSAINAALDYHTVASNNYDAKACGKLFTDEATYVNYGSEQINITGRKQIDSLLEIECEMFKNQQTKFDVKWTTHSLRLSNGKAYHDASVDYIIKNPNGENVNAAADALIAWEKVANNNWKIQTLIFYSH